MNHTIRNMIPIALAGFFLATGCQEQESDSGFEHENEQKLAEKVKRAVDEERNQEQANKEIQQETQIDQQAWDHALSTDTVEAYQTYLDAFPAGNYRNDALGRIELKAEIQSLKSKIKIRIKTSDKPQAGTDANVYIRIFGTSGDTGEFKLRDKPGINEFERGDIDEYTIQDIRDIGKPTRIVVHHDGSGVGPDWHLEWVEVTSAAGVQTFDCACWVERGQQQSMP